MIITTGLFPKYVVKIENGIITKDVFSFFGLFKKKNLSEEINLASVDYIYNAPLPKLIGTKHAVELVGKNATFYIANIPSGVAETIVNEAVKGGANVGEHSYTFIPSKRAMRKFSKGYTMLCDEYGRMIRKIYKKGSNDQEHLDLTDLSYFDDIKENGIKGIAFGKIAFIKRTNAGLQKEYVEAGTDILYAPTFRENEKFNNVFNYLDLTKFNERLSDEYVLLLRLHPKINKFYSSDIGVEGDYIDCSDYKNEQELMLLADILITDYSSIMIEFGLLNKPIVFFAYDLDNYLEKERGFYFDYREKVPGNIVQDTDELIEVIKNENFIFC